MNDLYVLNLMGPTASGKTQLAMSLYDHFDSEIISVDSAMIYKEMDIGTAKPDKETLLSYPHHLIDLIDPAATFSVSDFLKAVKPLIDQCHKNKKLPILVGGTMMYFNAFMHGLTELPHSDEKIRSKITKEGQLLGWRHLHQKLEKLDRVAASKIKPTDSQRITRALEVYQITNIPISQLWLEAKSHAVSSLYNVIQVGLVPENRAKLHQLIKGRFNMMMHNDFLDEVKQLYARGDLDLSYPSIRCVGYRQMWQHLLGEITFEQAIEQSIIATRQLAKRQITWLRHWQSDFLSFDPFDSDTKSKIFKYLEQKIGIL